MATHRQASSERIAVEEDRHRAWADIDPPDETEQGGCRGTIIITAGTQPVQKATHRGELLHRWSVGQRGREGRGIHMLSDEMHDGLFQHRGGQPPAGEVLLATVLDEAPGDVVAEPQAAPTEHRASPRPYRAPGVCYCIHQSLFSSAICTNISALSSSISDAIWK